jgi:hypothetical protein
MTSPLTGAEREFSGAARPEGGLFAALFLCLTISILAAYLLRAAFVARLLLSPFVAHNALIGSAAGRSRHPRLPAMFSALVLLAF